MPSASSLVIFQVPARGVRRRVLQEFAHALQSDVARGREFCCLIADDAELRKLNRRFRGHNYATDVLSFPAPSAPVSVEGPGTLGEIAISYDRAREQAGMLGHRTEDELRVLLLHGILHLTGLDHENDQGRMARIEKRWRRHFGLPSGLIERAAP